MTKKQAISQMKAGKKMTHPLLNGQWVKTEETGSFFTFENGDKSTSEGFWENRTEKQWETGWEVKPGF